MEILMNLLLGILAVSAVICVLGLTFLIGVIVKDSLSNDPADRERSHRMSMALSGVRYETK